MNKKSRKESIVFIILSLLLIPSPFVMVWAVANNNIFWMLLSSLFIAGTACIYTSIGIMSLK